jgi:uncharacterized protein
MEPKSRVGVGGSSGLIGTALRRALESEGYEVVPIVRRVGHEGEIEWDPATGRLAAADVATLDAVVNLAGAGIGDHRWSDSYRRTILSSRVDTTRLLADTFAALGPDAPATLVNASAIGYYGDRGDDELTERSPAGAGFLADVCTAWEAATDPAREVSRVVNIRTGIVLVHGGGALGKMLPLFKFGLGGRFGDGEQWMSWITLHDEIRSIVHLLSSAVSGPVNLTAPHPVRNREFADTLGSVLHRPTVIPVPEFGPKLLLGGELAQALLFDSARVQPAVLDSDGFSFDHPTLEGALRFVVDQKG